MSRSRKKNPGGTVYGCSQHEGKKAASKKFRRIAKEWLRNGSETLPVKSIELTRPYELGGDGKIYWKKHSDKFMRK